MRARKLLLPLLLAFGLLLGCSCAAETAAPAKEALIRNTAGLGKTTTYRLQEIAPAEISHTGTLTVSGCFGSLSRVRGIIFAVHSAVGSLSRLHSLLGSVLRISVLIYS